MITRPFRRLPSLPVFTIAFAAWAAPSFSLAQPVTLLTISKGAETVIASPDTWTMHVSTENRTFVEVSGNGPGGQFIASSFRSREGAVLEIGAHEQASPHSASATSMARIQGGPYCDPVRTRFNVLDISWNDLSVLQSFAANVQVACRDGTSLFAEIRVQSTIPTTASEAAGSSTPDAMAFHSNPAAFADTRVVSNPSRIYGVTADVPIQVTGGEYSLNGGPFTSAPAIARNGDEIALRLRAAALPGLQATASLNAGGLNVPFAVRTYAPAVMTAMTVRSQPDEYVGQQRTFLHVSPSARFEVEPSFNGSFAISASAPGGDNHSIAVVAPGGARLAPGTYSNAQRWPFQQAGRPGLSVTGNARGCNEVAGSFVVHEVEYSPSGDIVKLAADILQHCEGSGPPLHAELRYNSAVALSIFVKPEPSDPGYDANGDGNADILWRHTDGRQAMWLMSNGSQIGGGALFGAATGWTPSHTGDFNGDGRSDALWKHVDGRVALWLMEGAAQAGGGALLPAGTGWYPKHVGDFDGDGKSDIAWEHGDGRAAIWIMDGARQAGGTALFGAGTGWTASLLADFNADGKSDILWRHMDGRAALWLMDGNRQAGGSALLPAGTGWKAAAAGDFDGDGKADIAWHHHDGRVAIWTMRGASQSGGGALFGAGSTFAPILAGDIDGDGRADLVGVTPEGRLAYWLMIGSRAVGGGEIAWHYGGWTAVALADFDGDGRKDLLLAHEDGRARIDYFTGLAFEPTPILAPGTGWKPATTQD